MRRYNIYDFYGPEKEDDNGAWCKADEAIAGMESIAAELAVAQLRIAELENLLSTEREYSVEVVRRNNRFAERIAELEATLADERDTNARLQETINRNTVTFDQTKGILDALMRVLGNAI